MEFIRYGNLKSQEHNILDIDYIHTPPVKTGIYAFPKGYVDNGLLSGLGEGSVYNGRYRYYRNKYGNKIMMTYNEFEEYVKSFPDNIKKRLHLPFPWHSYLPYIDDLRIERDMKRKKLPVLYENDPVSFRYNGLIWHHLYKDGKDKYAPYYIKRVGAWVLSDIKTFEKCLIRATAKYKYACCHNHSSNMHMPYHDGYPISQCDKELFEVYIESIQKKK